MQRAIRLLFSDLVVAVVSRWLNMLFSDVNVEMVAILSNIASGNKPPLYRRRKVLVRLRVQGNVNDGVKGGKTRERLRDRAEKSLMYHTIAQLSCRIRLRLGR